MSDPLRDAGNNVLLWLLRNIAGEHVESIHSVALFNHCDGAAVTRSYLLVNGTHALLISGENCADDGDVELPATWQSAGVKVVAVCCEEMRTRCDRVDHTGFRLISWGSDIRVPLLSLKALAAHPLLESTANTIHPLIDEFRDSIQPVVAGEESFRALPLPEWDQLAWQGFVKVVARKLGGKIHMRPLGVGAAPFCRIQWKVGGMNCVLKGARFHVEFDAYNEMRLPDLSVYKHWMEHPQLAALGIKLRLEDYVPRKYVRLVDDEPEQTACSLKLILLEDFRVMKEDGLINIALSIGRVSAAAEILGHAVQ